MNWTSKPVGWFVVSRNSRPLVELMMVRIGVVKTGMVLAFMADWFYEELKKGSALDIEEFVAAGGMSRRTAFRRQADFRAVFEGSGLDCQTPSDLLPMLLNLHEFRKASRNERLAQLSGMRLAI